MGGRRKGRMQGKRQRGEGLFVEHSLVGESVRMWSFFPLIQRATRRQSVCRLSLCVYSISKTRDWCPPLPLQVSQVCCPFISPLILPSPLAVCCLLCLPIPPASMFLLQSLTKISLSQESFQEHCWVFSSCYWSFHEAIFY